jgi:coronin-1B/1C/6
MSRFVRASKVRHIYCDPPKPESTYQNLKLSVATGDHNYIKGNSKYFAIPIASGCGSLAIIPYEKTGKQNAQPPCLDGHKGAVLDFDFNPFHDQIIATGGDDAHLMVWGIPPGGLDSNLAEPLVDLQGHQRKITVTSFHPTAEHVVASGSADNLVKVWDVETGAAQIDSIEHPQLLADCIWNYDGSQLVTSCKDKQVRLIDGRNGKITSTVEAHEGTKTVKLTWLGDSNNFLTVGFTRQSKRQFKIWDQRKLDKGAALATADLDQAAGVIMPFYDEDLSLLYLAGKGDGNVRVFELVDDEPWQFSIMIIVLQRLAEEWLCFQSELLMS